MGSKDLTDGMADSANGRETRDYLIDGKLPNENLERKAQREESLRDIVSADYH